MRSIVIFILACLVTATAFAAAPKLINYQGRLTTSGGTPVADGIYTVRFRIYTDSVGGTSLWEETQPVQTKGGLFSVIFGGSTSMPDTLFNAPNRFLGIKVNLDTEISPRSRLVSAPYALETAQWSTSGAGHAVRSGPVGIGTSQPVRQLEIVDSSGAIATARFTGNNSLASTIELRNISGNGLWEIAVAGSPGPWSGTIMPKSLYFYRNGSAIPAFHSDSLNRVMMSAWPQVEDQPRLLVGAEYDPYCSRAIKGRGANQGVIGEATSTTGIGVTGAAFGNSSTGVYGYSTYWAGYFNGKLYAIQYATLPLAISVIDHPADPENKYLQHAYMDSPDIKSIYDGVVTLGADGSADVFLPEYVSAYNRDFRYQLTCVGGYAPVYIAQEIQGNRFLIAGGPPGQKVSWQVTGIRQDAYANAHRLPAEQAKPESERGYYMHPELFSQPEEKNIEWARRPEMMQRLKAEREASKR